MGAVTNLCMNTAGVVTFAEAGSMSFAGEAVADLFAAFFGDFFFFFFFSGDFNPILRFLWLGLVH